MSYKASVRDEAIEARRTFGVRRGGHRPALGLAALLLALPLIAACGKIGDPMPPLRTDPKRTDDLTVRQEGRLLLLEMSVPRLTSSGLALDGIDAVELWELVKPTTDPAAPPSPIEPAELEAVGGVLMTVRGDELEAARTADRVLIRLPLADPLPEEDLVHYFAVSTLRGKERSAISNLVAMVPIEPPEPPAELVLEALEDGVRVAWATESTAEGFEVFRREAQDRGYGETLGRVNGESREYVDQTAEYGRRYIYTVRTAARIQPPILSAPAGEREIDYQDRFAPPLPENFVGLGERNQARLRWDASKAPDVAGYTLYRQEPGRDYQRLGRTLVTDVEYVDTGLSSGLTFRYRIQAVDKEGNAGLVSDDIQVTVR